MHREFKKLLPNAIGASQFAIAVFVDIRGFSAFSQETESPDTAMYVKRVYARLIDQYFPDASFYKPTGDGLMVIIGYEEASLSETSSKTVRSALAAVNDFALICKDDPMINFPVPKNLGVGIARGTACKISSKDKVIDYSGRLLNLAARLTNLARPAGIVIDGDFWFSMIPEPERARFAERKVYLRGIAESNPRIVFVLDKVTNIPKENLVPLDQPAWETSEVTKMFQELPPLLPRYRIILAKRPVPSSIFVKVTYPLYKGSKRVKGHISTQNLVAGTHYDYQLVAGSPEIHLSLQKIIDLLAAKHVKSRDKVALTIAYNPN
jgi:class 3 adenylate cyclase